ncbi:MAG: mandelate racemase/muconate lactonizing enzyme family protein [Acetobacterales bacterium]
MRITDIESFILRLPDVQLIGDALQDILIVRVHTDEGLTGIGEVHTNPYAAKAIIDTPSSHISAQGLKGLLVGEDPRDINRLWDRMYHFSQTYGRRGLGIHAISGIDIALWDLLGKATGQPVYRLLGGARQKQVDVYASDLVRDTPEAEIERAQELVGRGYGAVKFGWGTLGGDTDGDIARFARLRDALGPDVDIMVDMGLPVPLKEAIRLGQALAEQRVFFLEEPLSPDDFDGWRRLVAASPTPIATGEKESTRFGFRDLIERGDLPIIQPDVARAGGLTECMRIAALAELRGTRVIPHCWSSDILIAATLHFIATLTDCPYLEYNVMEQPLRTDLAVEPIVPVDGRVSVPEKPGLGVELRDDTIARFRIG